MQTIIIELQSLYDLGDLVESQMNSDAVNDTIKFVIWLYNKTAGTNQINEIRYKLFAKNVLILKIYHQQKRHLPNTLGEFLIKYLFGKNAIHPIIDMPSSVGNRWKKTKRISSS